MSNLLTEGVHTGAYLVSEANNSLSREVIILASGNKLGAGTVLGKIASSGKYTALAVAAVAAVGAIAFTTNPANSQKVTIGGTDVTFVTSGATGNQLNIGASLAGSLAELIAFLSASPDVNLSKFSYALSGNTLQITAKTPGTAGNALTIATNIAGATASGATLSGGVAGSTDGSGTPSAILFDNVDATSADTEAVITARESEVNGNELIWPVGFTDNQKATASAALASLNIIVR